MCCTDADGRYAIHDGFGRGYAYSNGLASGAIYVSSGRGSSVKDPDMKELIEDIQPPSEEEE